MVDSVTPAMMSGIWMARMILPPGPMTAPNAKGRRSDARAAEHTLLHRKGLMPGVYMICWVMSGNGAPTGTIKTKTAAWCGAVPGPIPGAFCHARTVTGTILPTVAFSSVSGSYVALSLDPLFI